MNSIISIFLISLIGCVTVFQCHHHDGAGHPFFLTCFNEEVTGGLHSGDCHAHDCDGDGNDGSGPCGMHLSEMLTTDDSSADAELYTQMCVDFLPVEYDMHPSVIELIASFHTFSEFQSFCPSGNYGRTVTHRGPPSVVI